MGKLLPIFTIVGAAFAFLAALVLSVDATFVLGLIGIAAGVIMILQKEVPGYSMGALAIVLSIVGVLGIIGRVSGEDGEIDFGISQNLGRALLVVAMATPVASLVWSGWDTLANWVRYVGAGAAAATALLALVFMASLGDQSATGGFVVAFAALSMSIPGIMALRA